MKTRQPRDLRGTAETWSVGEEPDMVQCVRMKTTTSNRAKMVQTKIILK